MNNIKTWTTIIYAINPLNGKLNEWVGPHVPGETKLKAKRYCQENGLGYCIVDGELVSVIPTKEDGYTPDWDNVSDYNL